MARKMISYLSGYPRYKLIVEALKKLADFDLKMESYLIYRVRNHLDVIDLSVLGQVTIKGKKKKNRRTILYSGWNIIWKLFTNQLKKNWNPYIVILIVHYGL